VRTPSQSPPAVESVICVLRICPEGSGPDTIGMARGSQLGWAFARAEVGGQQHHRRKQEFGKLLYLLLKFYFTGCFVNVAETAQMPEKPFATTIDGKRPLQTERRPP
jgi:hypothetical protein